MTVPFRGLLLVAQLTTSQSALLAQTFTAAGAAIPDDGNFVEIPLVVSGLPAALDTINFGLESVCFSAQHTWIADLDVRIVAPDGTSRLLVNGNGNDTDFYTNTCFAMDATATLGSVGPPYTGTFMPQGHIGAVNNGQNGNGTWHLRVLDTYPFADAGSVISFSITFGNNPATYFSIQSSDLPLVVIDTDHEDIIDAEKIPGSMGIVYNGAGNLNLVSGPFNAYSGQIGIEVRGYSSQSLSPKKSYAVELRDADGLDVDASLLGMPEESDWILSANYFDKSFMNNPLTFHLAQQMGHYATRYRHVEVVLNGEYLGIYVLTEKIKRDAGRVDIAKLQPDEITGDDLTGGYILSVERNDIAENGFISDHPPVVSGNGQVVYLEHRYPKPDSIAPEQRTYIQDYIRDFEDALASPSFADPLTGYRAYIDVPSFIDFFLLNELSRNVDGYRLSSFVYKDKDSNGGLLHAGPVWDFDIAWGNVDYCDGYLTSGWAYQFGDVCGGSGSQIPFWWARLLEDPYYADAVHCRWNELRDNILSPLHVANYCDSIATVLDAAQQRNFTVWPILGQYVWPNPSPIPGDYAGEVLELKNWMADRWAWLNDHMPGDATVCSTVGIVPINNTVIEAPFPSPFTDHILVRTRTGERVQLQLLDAVGRVVYEAGAVTGDGALHYVELPAALAQGSYMLRARTTGSGTITSYRVQH